ncbi:hypothetical protein BH24ACT15_BH24ACT15_34030 [soil metagenome]
MGGDQYDYVLYGDGVDLRQLLEVRCQAGKVGLPGAASTE